jgi:translation initiation factor eIF-2B subunit alpha
MYSKLEAAKIPCKFIVDSAIGLALEESDIVLVGADAVVENGGIINRVILKSYYKNKNKIEL